MAVPFAMSVTATEFYERLAPLAVDDETNDYALARFCSAACAMLDPLELVRDDANGLGWTSLMDLERTPEPEWLSMFAGVRLQPGLTDADKRQQVDNTDGFKRGTKASIIGAVVPTLTGKRRALITERDGSAYRVRLVTYTSETPDAAATFAAALAQKPIGLVLTHQIVAGWLIDEVEAFYVSSTIATGPETEYASITAFENREGF